MRGTVTYVCGNLSSVRVSDTSCASRDEKKRSRSRSRSYVKWNRVYGRRYVEGNKLSPRDVTKYAIMECAITKERIFPRRPRYKRPLVADADSLLPEKVGKPPRFLPPADFPDAFHIFVFSGRPRDLLSLNGAARSPLLSDTNNLPKFLINFVLLYSRRSPLNDTNKIKSYFIHLSHL